MALLLPLAAVAANSSPVFAQSACGAQVNSSITATQQYYGSSGSYDASNYNWNIQMSVPVSASCSYTRGQLYATGNAFDTTSGTNLASANTVLNNVNGGYYNGQLVFTLPPSVMGHPLQISISVYSNYNGQYGSLVATTSQSVTIHPSNSYYQSNYQNNYQNNYPSYYYNQYPRYHYYRYGYRSYYYYYYNPYTNGCSYNNQVTVVYYNGYYHYVNC
jgi:hypothetical protein